MLISYTGDSLVNLQQKLLYKDRRLQKGLYIHKYILVPSYILYSTKVWLDQTLVNLLKCFQFTKFNPPICRSACFTCSH